MTLAINPSPQHTPLPIDSGVDNQKIVISRKAMLVDQMTAPLPPVATHFLAAFDEAREHLLAAIPLSCDDRIVVFDNVQIEEVRGGKVCFAF